MTTPNADEIYFVLVRPVFLGNIGSFARLLKNFGFRNLRFVDAPKNYKDAEARKMAVGAFDILKSSESFATLNEALADIGFIVGTTTGQQRTQTLLPLVQSLEKVRASSGNKIAIVFGDERNGLSNEEMSLCHILTCIETNKEFPSLNVAQAGCVIAYELSRMRGMTSPHSPIASVVALPTGKSVDEIFDQTAILLDRIDFSRKFNKEVVTKELRRIFYKAELTKRESDLFRGVLHKLNQALECTEVKLDFSED
ncbi:MAG: TrmJ/YjtD family RNA methyltransferase [Cyanobacteria bacterium SZAS-4]|nr:TrmJ/YjtD family RNA methyltransferase [Cyanobacteria bacterium SZAS-4]